MGLDPLAGSQDVEANMAKKVGQTEEATIKIASSSAINSKREHGNRCQTEKGNGKNGTGKSSGLATKEQ